MFKKTIENIKSGRPNFIFVVGLMLLVLVSGTLGLRLLFSVRWSPNSIVHNRYTVVQLIFLFYVTSSAGMLLLYIKIAERNVRDRDFRIKREKRKAIRDYIIGAILGSLLVITMVSLLLLFGSVYLNISSIHSSYRVHGLEYIVLHFFLWIIMSYLFEFMIRGWMWDVLNRRYSPRVAVVASSMILSIYFWIIGYQTSLLGGINTFLFNVLLCLLAYVYDNVHVAAGFNTAYSWLQIQVLGFNLPGMRRTFSLINFSSSGTSFINGGCLGPNAGIVATILFILAILFTCIVNQRRIINLMDA